MTILQASFTQILFVSLGVTMPFSLSIAVFRLLSGHLEDLEQFEIFSLQLCSLDRYLNSTFLSFWFYMNVVALIFR